MEVRRSKVKKVGVRKTSNKPARRAPSKAVKTDGHRSGFEAEIAKNSPDSVGYEDVVLDWTPKARKYKPDFTLANGILVEAKGWFRPEDRTKMELVIKQNPNRDIRMLFQNANAKLNSKSKTTYGVWCDKRGIKWAQGDKIPESWLSE